MVQNPEKYISKNYPFRRYKMKEQVYGSPFYPTREELKHLYAFKFENKSLNEQRDIFIFQCQVGMHIHDSYQLTRNNINNKISEYIPAKTKRFRAKTVSIPLNAVAMEILDRYSANEKLLPFVCVQVYNRNLKLIFKTAGLDRMIVQYDKVKKTNIHKPLFEVATSHIARKTAISRLYNQGCPLDMINDICSHVGDSIKIPLHRF